ncbi:MAG: hypothetical protein MRJ96_11725 [Nitrospirales bacterium]|nr:hypothetical protein [Nitrospira sp.]MDR4502109.1 hypothetical protein [Nitrospirales bacterium]
MVNSQNGFYFTVVFWGQEHREYFLRLLVPSLLSPGNLPSLENASASRFLICTTTKDWNALQADLDFLALQRIIKPVFLEIPMPAHSDNKYLAMSAGHKLATEKVFTDRACGVFLTPDLVVADGGVCTLQELALAGKVVVLCAAMRYTYEGAVPEIEALRPDGPGKPLVLSPRRLANIALRHMHVESLRYDWDAPWFAEMPFSSFLRAQGNQGILIHNFNWAPVFVDYAKLSEHRVDTFEHSTMDADYIYQNFGDCQDIHVIQDSDQFLLISFTKKEDLPGHLDKMALQPSWEKSWPLIGYYWKLHKLRWLLTSGSIDPLKRKLFRLPVRLHCGEISESEWRLLEKRAATIVTKALSRLTLLEWLCTRIVRFVQSSTMWPFSQLNQVDSRGGPSEASNQEIMNQAGVGTYRIWVMSPLLTSGKWYWEVFSSNVGTANGMVADTVSVGVIAHDHSIRREIGCMKNGWGWRCDGYKMNRGRRTSYGSPVHAEDELIMIAVDLDSGALWFGRNGDWFESSDPMHGKDPAFKGLPSSLYPAVSSKHGGQGTANLHIRVTSDSWTYKPPHGFRSLTEVVPGREPSVPISQVSAKVG